jgi:hypothetical protein
LVILSLAHGRIALAHLAPWRSGNSLEGVTEFVLATLNKLLGPEIKPTPRRHLQSHPL